MHLSLLEIYVMPEYLFPYEGAETKKGLLHQQQNQYSDVWLFGISWLVGQVDKFSVLPFKKK